LSSTPSRKAIAWISFNVVLFSAYAFFGVLSVFLPEAFQARWLYPLHIAGLLFTLAILYGLLERKYWTAFLIVPFSVGMMLHLSIFIIYPLSMAIAYIGPSRSFMAFISFVLSRTNALNFFTPFFMVFNSAMIVVHLVNIVFFLRRDTATFFAKNSKGVVEAK